MTSEQRFAKGEEVFDAESRGVGFIQRKSLFKGPELGTSWLALGGMKRLEWLE